MKVKPNLATSTATLVFTSAVCFFLTTLVGLWSAYERHNAMIRFGLLAVGLVAMVGIGWQGRHHPKTTLSMISLGCTLLAAGIGVAYFLSFTTNTGMVASSLLVLFPLGLVGVVWHRDRHNRRQAQIGAGALLVALVAFVLCFERTAWLGLLGGIAGVGFVYWRFKDSRLSRSPVRWVIDVVVIAGILVGLIAYGALLSDPNLDSLAKATPFGGALFERVPLWRKSLSLIQDYYFTGSGLGETAMVYSTYVYLLHVPFLYHAHNLFLQIAIEQGVPGLVAFIGIALPLLGSLIATYQQVGPHTRQFCLATIAALGGILIYGFFDSEIYATVMAPILFIPLGYALALHWSLLYRQRRHHPAPAQLQTDPARRNRIWVGALPIVAIALLLLKPSPLASLQANLGAVAQTKAELGLYDWPAWPIQDELRRSSKVDLATAMTYYNAALALDPSNVTAHQRLGQVALSRGNYQTAFAQLNAAYATAPQRDIIRQLLGEVYAATGHVKEAAALWQTVDMQPNELADRLWWYTHINAQQEANWIRQVVALVH